jgi:hypothetical protein
VADGSASASRIPAAGLSRRALLTASAAALPLLVTACRGIQVLGTPPPPPADVRTLQAAIAAEEAMVARYASALKLLTPAASTRYGAAAAGIAAYASVSAVHAEHVAHLAQLKSRLVEPPGARPSALIYPTATPGATTSQSPPATHSPTESPPANSTPTSSPTSSPTSAPSSPATGAPSARGVLGELELAEQAASDRLIADLGGLPPSLAQLFASIAASEATHVEYLRAARRSR